MKNSKDSSSGRWTQSALEATIRIGLLLGLSAWCFYILQPFIVPILWGIIIAVAVYPAHLWLVRRLHGRNKTAAFLLTLLAFILLIVLTVLVGGSLADGTKNFIAYIEAGKLAIPLPPTVAQWPILGEPISQLWSSSFSNLEALFVTLRPTLKVAGNWLLLSAAKAGIGLLQFMLSIVIAGVLLANADAATQLTRSLAERLATAKGLECVQVTEIIIKKVALGIVGVAFVQAGLAGIGFASIGLPAAGLWTFICLILSAVQIGVWPVIIPAVIYSYSHDSLMVAVVFTVWAMIVSVIDNILKPIFFGGHAEVPMLVIFLGAVGGLITSGLIGLFTGAVILALSYKLLLVWLYDN